MKGKDLLAGEDCFSTFLDDKNNMTNCHLFIQHNKQRVLKLPKVFEMKRVSLLGSFISLSTCHTLHHATSILFSTELQLSPTGSSVLANKHQKEKTLSIWTSKTNLWRNRKTFSSLLNQLIHLLLFITRKYTLNNANLKLTNAKIRSFYSTDIH